MMEATERDTYISALLPRVRALARRLKRIVPNLDLDDLTGDGFVGLIRAVDSFDPARGPQLDEYARRLIVGAMLNGIRRMDPVSERARRIVRDGENERYTRAAACGEIPSLAEMERRRPGYERALGAAHRGQPLSLDAPLPIGESLSGDWSEDPARIVEQRLENKRPCALVAGLPPRQRQIVTMHYFNARSLRSVGKAMAISAQRASQLHIGAIERLKRQWLASS